VLTAGDDSLRGVDSARSRVLLGALAAELSHDLQGPLNLFRLMTERVARGAPLEADDVELLQEELARLGRMNARLRELAVGGAGKAPSTPGRLLELAAQAASIDDQTPSLTLDAAAGDAYELSCDAPRLGFALGELLRNALEARQEVAGVRFFMLGDATGFCVWDDGPGFTVDFEQALSWGVTTKSGAAGLGLTLALRAARAHGYSLECHRTPGLTEVRLLIPARELRPVVAKVDQ
jgi:signal transduction histidine kinase